MIRRIAMALSFVSALRGSAWAQLASQTALVGTVTDSGGLVVPGAQVVAVNTGTKDTYEATTNTEGYYNIPFARPGRYEMTVTYDRLPDVQDDRRRAEHQPGRAHECDLPVGGGDRVGERESAAQVINTDRATVSETINERAIVELPLSGRNVWNLASTTPGVLSAASTATSA